MLEKHTKDKASYSGVQWKQNNHYDTYENLKKGLWEP